MWKWWLWLAESDTCVCNELRCLTSLFSLTPNAWKRCYLKKNKQRVTQHDSQGNGNHLSLSCERRKIRRHDTMDCLHWNRELWQSRVLKQKNKKTKAALSRCHQCQKLGTKNYIAVQRGFVTSKTTNELWVAELKCFPWMAVSGARAARQSLLQESRCLY